MRMNINQYEVLEKKPLKFTPRTELRLLGCLSVIIFLLAAPKFLEDSVTPRNPENIGSHFSSCIS